MISFYTILYAMMKIVIIALLAAVLVKKKVISNNDIDSMSKITVYILLPCMIIASFLNNFDPDKLEWWWMLPVSALVMNIGGLISGRIFLGSFRGKNSDLIAMSSLQNSVYLILPFGQALFPTRLNFFVTICFLYVTGAAPVLWTAGKILVGEKTKISLKDILNPPLIATIAGISIVLFKGKWLIPEILIQSMEFTGSATIPIATFILGATLGQINIKKFPPALNLCKMGITKFIILPFITLKVLIYFNLTVTYPVVSALLIMEAASAPATALILISRTYNGDTPKIGAAMLFSYGCCIIALPLWVSLGVGLH